MATSAAVYAFQGISLSGILSIIWHRFPAICCMLIYLFHSYPFSFPERVGAKVVECACVIELPELKVYSALMHQFPWSAVDKYYAYTTV